MLENSFPGAQIDDLDAPERPPRRRPLENRLDLVRNGRLPRCGRLSCYKSRSWNRRGDQRNCAYNPQRDGL